MRGTALALRSFGGLTLAQLGCRQGFPVAKNDLFTAAAAACLAVLLADCASQTRTMPNSSTATEEQRATAALASEATAEINKCIALSAALVTGQPSSREAQPEDIANKILSQCEYLLNEYERNDTVLVLASDPNDDISFANRHATQSRAELSQSAHRRAMEIVLDERATLARQ